MAKTKIGIVGCGFVGSAVQNNLNKCHDIRVYDIDPEKCHSKIHSVSDLAKWASIIFVSVPTLSTKDPSESIAKSCDISIVEKVIKEATKSNPDCLITIKSTIPPGTSDKLAKKFKARIAFNPEFLTERNSIQDFAEHSPIILGVSNKEDYKILLNIYKKMMKVNNNILEVVSLSRSEAEMIKYAANCFLATKVTFANEIFNICKQQKIDYDNIKDCLLKDDRLGKTHWSVPGPDGKFGFGGSCFPKDTSAMIAHARSLNVNMPLLESVVTINSLIRDDI